LKGNNQEYYNHSNAYDVLDENNTVIAHLYNRRLTVLVDGNEGFELRSANNETILSEGRQPITRNDAMQIAALPELSNELLIATSTFMIPHAISTFFRFITFLLG
jgi:hypothetical protein